MASENNSKPNGKDSPIGKKEPPLSSQSTQQQGPEGEPKIGKSLKDHDNPVIRTFARMGFWVWIMVMAVGLGLAFLVSLALL